MQRFIKQARHALGQVRVFRDQVRAAAEQARKNSDAIDYVESSPGVYRPIDKSDPIDRLEGALSGLEQIEQFGKKARKWRT